MAPDEIANRLSRIEDRLTALESRFAPAAQARPVPPPPQGRTVPPPPGRAPTPAKMEVAAVGDAPSFATSVLGWGGGLALGFAAAYLSRLAIAHGWLPPLRPGALARAVGPPPAGEGVSPPRAGRHGRRLICQLALYLALIGFDAVRSTQAAGDWQAALVFQTAQFVIFGIATAAFSIRRNSPLDANAALAHLPPLLIFYFLQYSLLHQHLPAAAPWIAAATAGVVGALYGIARATLQRPLPGGELLLWCYVALVLFHAGYIESVPRILAPLVAFLLVPVVAASALWRGAQPPRLPPLRAGAGGRSRFHSPRVRLWTDVPPVQSPWGLLA